MNANASECQHECECERPYRIRFPNKCRHQPLKSDLALADLHEIASNEKAWFENNLKELVTAGVATTDVLVAKLQKRYVNFIKDNWLPKTVLRLCDEQQSLFMEDEKMGLPSPRKRKRLGGPAGEVTGSRDPRALAKYVADALMAMFKKVAIAELFEGIAKGELKELSEGCSRDLGEACSPQSIDEINTLLTADGEDGEGLIARLRVRCAKVRCIAPHLFYTVQFYTVEQCTVSTARRVHSLSSSSNPGISRRQSTQSRPKWKARRWWRRLRRTPTRSRRPTTEVQTTEVRG